MNKIKIKKRIWIPAIVLILGGYLLYNIVFISDIAITRPNVNNKKLNNLELINDTLRNGWKDKIPIEAGRLVVKENRLKQNSNNIEISFYRIKSKTDNPISPVIFLAGGPGSSGTDIGQSRYFYLFEELSKYADVILLDQRGTGGSIPNLNCRNFLSLPDQITENVKQQILEDIVEKCVECADEFRYMGIDLNGYNTYENAKDIDELRKSLGYDKITLYGYSYGTELAQTYIKLFEDKVDKAILAGPLAPDQGVKLPKDVEAQFIHMDSLIRQDKRLSTYVPDFLSMVKKVHASLQDEPKFIHIPVVDAFGNTPSDTDKKLADLIEIVKPGFDMYLTDDHLQMIVSDKIGLDSWISKFPSFYYNMSIDDYREVGNNLRNFRRRRMPNALFFTVNASTRYPKERWKKAISQEETTIFSNFGVSYSRYPEVYKAFNIPKGDGFNDPVSAETNVLLIGGTLDGRTPLSYGDEIAERFPNNKRIIVENAGHNELISNEIMYGIKEFLRDSLKENLKVVKPLEFENPVPYKYSISDTLKPKVLNGKIDEAAALYRELYSKYNDVPDYIFDFRADPLFFIVDELMDNEEYDKAFEFLQFAVEEHPTTYYFYRFIGQIYYIRDDKENAITYVNKALNLNFFDGKSHMLMKEIRAN